MYRFRPGAATQFRLGGIVHHKILRHLATGGVLFVLLFIGASTVDITSAQVLPRSSTVSFTGTTGTIADTPEILVRDAFDEWTVGGGYLYWAMNCSSDPPGLIAAPSDANSHYALHRWPIAGGTPETISTASHANCNTFRFLAADDDGVFFWNASLSRLEHYPAGRPPGQSSTVVRESINNVTTGLYVDNNNIYFANSNRIRRVPKSGASNKLIHDLGSFVVSMAVDTDRSDIYWIDSNGLWLGQKNCSSTPCTKSKLSNATGSHILLGPAGLHPRTIYMVQPGDRPTIQGYNCSIQPCQVQLWHRGPSTSIIGLPSWTTAGFVQPKNWLVWPEYTAAEGRVRQRELDPVNPPPSETRFSGHPDIALKAIIADGQFYFGSREPGNERIMRLPLFDEPEPRNFGNLSPVGNPQLSNEWKPIVRVEARWDEKPNEPFLCTGTLIDPGIVVTAGACVYGNANGYEGWADSVHAIPAYTDGSQPFGDAYGQKLWAFDEFIDSGSVGYDIGLIKLGRPVGALTGWHDIGWGDDLFLWLATFNNPGYPRAGFDSQLLYNRSGQFSDILTHRLVHTGEAANMKGSPALNLDDRTVYGVESRLINSGATTAYARLTQAKVGRIESFITDNTPTNVDLAPLKFRIPPQGGLVAGTWFASGSFILHNYSTASIPAGQTVSLKIYLSGDKTIDQTDTFLASGSFQVRGTLEGRQNFLVLNVNWAGAPAIPLDTPPGAYWLGIILDQADAVPANNATDGWDAVAVQILPPQMTVTPDILTASANSGDPPVERTITVDILGNGAGNPSFNWTGTANAAWLSINPADGGDGQEVTVTIDGDGLGPGTHHGQINFASALQDHSGIPVASAVVNVTLNTDVGAAVWQPEPAEMDFEAISGGANPPSQGLIIKATVDYPFNWIVEDGSPLSSDAAWLPINRGAGTAPGMFYVTPDISGLAPGKYSTQLAIHSPGQNNYALTTINLTVHEAGAPRPILQVFPTTLFYEAMAGQPGPEPQSVAIANTGTGQLNWTASSNVDWLNLDKNSGSGDAEVRVGVVAGGLSPATHVSQITVADGAGNQQVVRAVLQLRQPPTMVIDGDYLVFSGLNKQVNPSPQSFTVRNRGTGGLDWTATETSEWLEMAPSQGTAPAAASVAVDTTKLEPGTHQSSVKVTSPTALGSPQEVDVRLFLRQGPVLDAAPQVLEFNTEAGASGSEQKTITIANVSRGNMAWTAESNANWLSLGQAAGVTGAFAATTVNVNANAANLGARDEAYVGQITVRTGNGEGSPQTITVFLHVVSPARYCNIPNGGEGYVVNSRNAKLRFTEVQRTLTPDGGCDFRANLRVSLPQNASLQSQVTGHVDGNNLFVPTSSSPLMLKVAIFSLQLTGNFSISDEFGLKAPGGQWRLPTQYGGNTRNVDGAIQINANGISLAGAGTFELPNIEYGAMQIRQLQGEVSVAADLSYLVEVSGDMEIGVVGDGTVIEDIELRLDQRGFRSGQIGTFTINDTAGVDIEVVSATFDSSQIQADEAILKIPRAWGGAEGALYGLAIDFNGNLTVTGGRFKLPSISAGGDSFRLSSLEGEFRPAPGGYEIQARGEFGMSGIGESGGCTLIVDVTIFSEKGASILVIDSADGQRRAGVKAASATTNNLYGVEGAEAIGLRELTLGVWDCQPGLPIGPTGFELTGVQGTVKLRATLEEVSLKVQIQTIAKLGTIPFISVEPQATLRPEPFFLGYEGPTYMTNIRISDTIGKFEKRRFSAEMLFDFTVLHGGLHLGAGVTSGGDFRLGGNGWADLSVKKGAIFRECALGLCANFPPVSVTVAEAEAEVNLTHIFGRVKVLGHGASFKFSFATGDLDISLTSLVQVITSQDVLLARAFSQSNQGPPPANSAQIAFAGSESVLLTLPVEAATPQLDAATPQAITAGQSDALFILVQPANGQLNFVLIDPNGHEYTAAELPENIQFEQAVIDGVQQTVYSVAQAKPGAWQTRVEGDVNGTDFAVFEAMNVSPGILDNLSLTPAGGLNQVEVQWRHLAQEATPSITIYANAEEITQTVTYTNAHGVTVIGTGDKFVGEPVAEFSSPPTDGRLETTVIDLSQLPSAAYAFWIEAEGALTSGVRCYIRQGGSGCDEPAGDVARFIVDHSSTFPSAWDPGLATDVAVRDGLLNASWDASTHPDVDRYLLTLHGEGVLRPGVETYAEISVPSVRGQDGRVTATMDTIEPGAIYRLAIKAVDDDGSRSVQSPLLVVTTPQPDFELTSPDKNALVQAGGQPRTVVVDLEMSSILPYDPVMSVDSSRLPDGLYVSFWNDALGERPTTRGMAAIRASSDLPPGYYVVPIVARSGKLERMLNLPIEVTPPKSTIMLPFVLRQSVP